MYRLGGKYVIHNKAVAWALWLERNLLHSKTMVDYRVWVKGMWFFGFGAENYAKGKIYVMICLQFTCI